MTELISARELIAKAKEIVPFLAPQLLATLKPDKDGVMREQPRLVEDEKTKYARLNAYGNALHMFPDLVRALEMALVKLGDPDANP